MSAAMRISTVIATCNRAAFLVEALDNVAAQHLRPREVIVVDDGSGPETRQAVETWRSRKAPAELELRYFYQPNSGPAVARNRGLAESRGDLIHFMDDDDLMAPNALAQLAAALEGVDGAAVAMASHALRHHGREPEEGEPVIAPGSSLPARVLAAMIAGHWFVPVHGYLFTREALQRMGPWDPSYSSQEDDEFLFRAALQGVAFIPAPASLVYYRQHNGVRRATPGKPGETVAEGLRKRLYDDLNIRERVARELAARGLREHYRAAFHDWHRRLVERYGKLLHELEEEAWSLLDWLAGREVMADSPEATPAPVAALREGGRPGQALSLNP